MRRLALIGLLLMLVVPASCSAALLQRRAAFDEFSNAAATNDAAFPHGPTSVEWFGPQAGTSAWDKVPFEIPLAVVVVLGAGAVVRRAAR